MSFAGLRAHLVSTLQRQSVLDNVGPPSPTSLSPRCLSPLFPTRTTLLHDAGRRGRVRAPGLQPASTTGRLHRSVHAIDQHQGSHQAFGLKDNPEGKDIRTTRGAHWKSGRGPHRVVFFTASLFDRVSRDAVWKGMRTTMRVNVPLPHALR